MRVAAGVRAGAPRSDAPTAAPCWGGGGLGAASVFRGLSQEYLKSQRPEILGKQRRRWREQELRWAQRSGAVLCWKHVGVRARVGREGVESSLRQQLSPRDARGTGLDVGRGG